jgi:hypothetical protein
LGDKLEEELFFSGIVRLKSLKQKFMQKFPNSSITSYLQSLPDEISGEELIGAVGVWLSILDMESANNLKGGK